MRHLVVRIQKIHSDNCVTLEEVLCPRETRHGVALKRWMSERRNLWKGFLHETRLSASRLSTWLRSSSNDLSIEDAVKALKEDKPLTVVQKRQRCDCKSLTCRYKFKSLLDYVEYEIYVEGDRILQVAHSYCVPSSKMPSKFFRYILENNENLLRELREMKKKIDWSNIQQQIDFVDNWKNLHDFTCKLIKKHMQIAQKMNEKPNLLEIWRQYWIKQNTLDILTHFGNLEKVEIDSIKYLRNRYWSLVGSYKYEAHEFIDIAIERGWLTRQNDYITFTCVYDTIQELKKTLKDAKFVLGDPDYIKGDHHILVHDEETQFELECRLADAEKHRIINTISEFQRTKMIKKLMIYRAHQYNLFEWSQLVPYLKKIKRIEIYGRNDQYGHLFAHMLKYHPHIEKPLSTCYSVKFIYNCQSIQDFHVKPSKSCQYMASEAMDVVLTPQRIWLYYPKRIRTIKRRMAPKTFFEERREMQRNVFKIHDASIIAVKDYNGPTLANIVMIVDKNTKAMDMQIVRTMACHRVYYLVMDKQYNMKETTTPHIRPLIY